MAEVLNTYVKDPNAVLDYSITWADQDGTNDGSASDDGYLQGDTISTSSWIADSGLTIASHTNTTTTATVWLSGGDAGGSYTVTNRIITAGGRTDDRSIEIKAEER